MIDRVEILALKGVCLKDSDYRYRKICRYYSHHFSTPLMDVYELPWFHVLQNYLEHVLEQKNEEALYELVLELVYPEKIQQEEDSVNDWIKQIEEEEKAKREKMAQKDKTLEEPISIQSTSFEHLEEEMEQEVDKE